MKYRLDITEAARRQLRRLDPSVQNRVLSAVHELADTPRPHGCLKMRGETSYRIRVGDYRIVYEIHDRIITVIVVGIGNRKDIYR
jgi:mRNA interferase RelE/StbE